MKNTKILEMINNGQIAALKSEIQDEIYRDILGDIPNAKKRYSAMKRYLKFNRTPLDKLQHPCRMAYNGDFYTAFCNTLSFVLTTEASGTLALTDDDKFFHDLSSIIKFTDYSGQFNYTRMLADAKSDGYILKLSAIKYSSGYFPYYYVRHGDGYFTLGLIDVSYAIINDGKNCRVYHDKSNRRAPMILKNDVGMCAMMPVVDPQEHATHIINLEDYFEVGKE